MEKKAKKTNKTAEHGASTEGEKGAIILRRSPEFVWLHNAPASPPVVTRTTTEIAPGDSR